MVGLGVFCLGVGMVLLRGVRGLCIRCVRILAVRLRVMGV